MLFFNFLEVGDVHRVAYWQNIKFLRLSRLKGAMMIKKVSDHEAKSNSHDVLFKKSRSGIIEEEETQAGLSVWGRKFEQYYIE